MTAASSPSPRPGRGWPVRYTPKLVSALREGYGLADLRADALAGLSVAIVALPLAMAIAIASGAEPRAGLVTAVVAGALISALGGSRHQIGGPTAAFVVVVFEVIATHGYDGLLLASLMAGAMLIAAGALRLGLFMKYVPQPVVLGFTAGIAVLIVSTQFGDLLGFPVFEGEANVVGRWRFYLGALGRIDPAAALLGALSLAAIVALRARFPRLPAFLIVAAGASLVVALGVIDAPTIGTRFGGVPRGLPRLAFPDISLDRMAALLPSAFTIAFLAGVESLLSAVVADGMTGRRHRSDCELIAQGVANMASACVGGLPATGAIARTATNIRAGARTPVSGILHSGFLLVFLLLAAPLADAAPLAVLAAILTAVALSMAEPRKVWLILRGAPLGDRLVFVVTFALTVFSDLTLAVQVGVVLAAILFMHRMAQAVEITHGESLAEAQDDDAPPQWRASLPPGVRAYTISGPLFYGAAGRVREVLGREAADAPAFVLSLRQTPVADITGAEALKELAEGLSKRRGALVILAGANPSVRAALAAAGLEEGPHVRFAATGEDAARIARAAAGGESDVKEA